VLPEPGFCRHAEADLACRFAEKIHPGLIHFLSFIQPMAFQSILLGKDLKTNEIKHGFSPEK
jgi:hypothetical protein